MLTIRCRHIFALVGLSLLFSCGNDSKKVIEAASVTFTKEGELSLYKAASDSIITSYDIEIAETDYETQTGLMYRDSMKKNEAMLFVFPTIEYHSFYMKNTKIPLDILFIDEEYRIVNIKENAQPFDESGISSGAPIKYVLEVNGGQSQLYGIQVGDQIRYTKF